MLSCSKVEACQKSWPNAASSPVKALCAFLDTATVPYTVMDEDCWNFVRLVQCLHPCSHNTHETAIFVVCTNMLPRVSIKIITLVFIVLLWQDLLKARLPAVLGTL